MLVVGGKVLEICHRLRRVQCLASRLPVYTFLRQPIIDRPALGDLPIKGGPYLPMRALWHFEAFQHKNEIQSIATNQSIVGPTPQQAQKVVSLPDTAKERRPTGPIAMVDIRPRIKKQANSRGEFARNAPFKTEKRRFSLRVYDVRVPAVL